MALTRRSFLVGLGSVSVGLLFRRQLDAVLESLERDLVEEPVVPDQPPSAAEIIVLPQLAFRPKQLVVPSTIAAAFVLENIFINGQPQFMKNGGIPAELFTPSATTEALYLATAPPWSEIRFRIRYVGSDPNGQRFFACLSG